MRTTAGPGSLLTVLVPILRSGADSLPLDLDVFPAGSAVELVNPDLPAAELVRRCALRPHILVKIRRRVILPLFYAKGKIKSIIVSVSNLGCISSLFISRINL